MTSRFAIGSCRRVVIMMRRSVLAVGALWWLLGQTGWAESESARLAPPSVETLIEQLGSAEYSLRQKARAELAELGVEAFDALQAAQLDQDMEIRKQAEYLVRAIRVAWIQEDDPDAVRQILRDYHGESLEERQSRLERLSRLPDGIALEPFCRLVRFETSDLLSKRAALLALDYPLPSKPEETEPWSSRIRRVIGTSPRAGAEWLRLYAQYLEDPGSTLDQWVILADAEAAELRVRPDKLRSELLRDFLRWQVDMWEKHGNRAQAIATMQRTLPMQNASRAELLDTADWLLARSAWPLIDALAQQFPQAFENDPYLLYRRAEALLRQDQSSRAAELVQRAREMRFEDEPLFHVNLGRELQQRGLTEWAEGEFRHTIQVFEEGTHANLDARISLGWLLHDLARHAEAAAVLQAISDGMDRDTTVVRRLQELQRDPTRIRGQMHFSRALDHHEQGRYAEERQELEQALSFDALNADILIAMHRVPEAPDNWREQTQDRIDKLTQRFRAAILLAERNQQAAPSDESNEQLALMLNQFAWLAANTGGDLQAALSSSRKSLELIPDDPGYLDTLGRCYYALGDFENAVKYQRQAVAREPGSAQIRRQLELFEQALLSHATPAESAAN